jgi:hypothetical protein
MAALPPVSSLATATASPPAASAPAPAGASVSGVTVTAGPPPQVVSTFPAEGASAPAGVIVLKVVFDQAMTPKAWSFGHVEGQAYPDCLARPRLLDDRKTFALLCTVAADQAYAVQINPAPVFANAGGRTAKPYVLRFKTADVSVRNMHDALVQAGLTDSDDPIMSWNDAGGVSRSAPPAEDSAEP